MKFDFREVFPAASATLSTLHSFLAPQNVTRRLALPKLATRLFVDSPTRHPVRFTQNIFQDGTHLRCPHPHLFHDLLRILRHHFHVVRRNQQRHHAIRADGVACRLLHRIHAAHFTMPQPNASGLFLRWEWAYRRAVPSGANRRLAIWFQFIFCRKICLRIFMHASRLHIHRDGS